MQNTLKCKEWQRIMQKPLKSNDWQRIWVLQISEHEIQKGGTKYLSPSAELASPIKLGPSFSLRKSQITEKSTTESCRTHWNVKNDKEFESFNFLKMKYKKGDWIIQSFWNIGFPEEIISPSLIWGNFKKLRKSMLNHVECI